MSNERLGVPDYQRLVREALAEMGSARAKKVSPPVRNKVGEGRLNSLKSLNSQGAVAKNRNSDCTIYKTKHINNINDRYIIDEVVGESSSSAAGEKNELSELRVFGHEFEALLSVPPKGVHNREWVKAIGDADAFLTTWGEQAAALGWTAEELFGLDPVAPLHRYDTMGLIWLLQGRPVVALTESTAAIKTPTGDPFGGGGHLI